jgi:hypothetical protein
MVDSEIGSDQQSEKNKRWGEGSRSTLSRCEGRYYSDMKSIVERQHTPILEGLNVLTGEWGWVVEVIPLVSGQRSVWEKEWLEVMKTFGIRTEDGKRIMCRLGSLLLSD